MVKAIVRINAFLDKKQMEEVYAFIYGQLKSDLEVITVPNYCDVYIVDVADVEVQTSENQKIRTHIEDAVKSCQTCKYEGNEGHYQPCISCTHNNKWEKWGVKDE